MSLTAAQIQNRLPTAGEGLSTAQKNRASTVVSKWIDSGTTKKPKLSHKLAFDSSMAAAGAASFGKNAAHRKEVGSPGKRHDIRKRPLASPAAPSSGVRPARGEQVDVIEVAETDVDTVSETEIEPESETEQGSARISHQAKTQAKTRAETEAEAAESPETLAPKIPDVDASDLWAWRGCVFAVASSVLWSLDVVFEGGD